MKTIIVNALCANNNSQLNVITGHIENILVFNKSKVIVFLTNNCYKDFTKNIQKNNQISYVKLPYFGLFSRVFYEIIYIPLFVAINLNKKNLFVNFSGIKQFFCFIPQIIYSHNPMPLLYPKLNISFALKLKQLFLKLLLKISLLFSYNEDIYFFNSYYMKNLYLKKIKNLKKKNLIVCFNPVKRISEVSPSKTLPIQYPLKFLAVCSLDKYKNPHLLIKSFIKFLNFNENSKLIIVGKKRDKKYFNYLKMLIPFNQRKKIILITDTISQLELYKFYKDAFLYISASSCESFGLPAVEAQSFGTPSLVSPDTAAEEIVGKGGLICDFDNENNMTLIVQNLLNNPSLYSQLSIKSIKNYKRFSSLDISKPFININ